MRKVFELALATRTLRLTGDLGTVLAYADREVGGDSTIRPSRVLERVWSVADAQGSDVGTLYELDGWRRDV